ncbi:MAG: Uma2 family endonuclease [candidate division KSB1 bacterium]|nr:Uma2 family endonuclease [candidate division KSB1 bacterium]MDZ7274368.1 Uma2 family endonuclease [candidate division KSB1 bacterium]MDZ7284970.1 Uma2 family endonuclease [candidate division KSB1 bacterium]MDZ7297609.1 Uma2 family endonuclease [candidate division KSB1 bacterium]MDZ7306349.1 Uma2 family endonuclease [candidate division KSB1 bacterium]
MKLDDENVPRPDLMFTHKVRLLLLGGTEWLRPADVAVEVISPASQRLEMVDKRNLCADFGG